MLRFNLAAVLIILAFSLFVAGLLPAMAETGRASFYCCEHQGRRTASGERFDQNALTAAHPSLRFGTKVLVTNLRNGRTVVVRINDRGPFVGGRIIDLTKAAFAKIGNLATGVVRVRIKRLKG